MNNLNKVKEGDYFLYNFTGGFPSFDNRNRIPITFLAQCTSVRSSTLIIKDLKCLTVVMSVDDPTKKISIPLDDEYSSTVVNSVVEFTELIKPVFKTNGSIDYPKTLPQYFI